MATRTIGATGDHSTIALWEDFVDGVLADVQRGECQAQAFDEDPGINGSTATASNYMHLTSVSGAEHDGRAHDVSALGNARIARSSAAITLEIFDGFTRLDWMEIKGPGANSFDSISLDFCAPGDVIYVHHNVIHNDGATTNNGNSGIRVVDADIQAMIYRNIIYGSGGSGIRCDNAAVGSVIFYNTIAYNNLNNNASRGGIAASANFTVKYNAAFANGTADILNANGTQDYNYTEDAVGEGANSVGSLTTASQFVNPTTTYSAIDLLIKTGADLIDHGVNENTTTYPEIDVSIDNRGVSISGTWDIGAAEFVGGGGGDAAATGFRALLGVGVK